MMCDQTSNITFRLFSNMSDFLRSRIGRDLFIVAIIGLIIRYVVGAFFTYPTDVIYWVIVSENLFSNEGLYGLPGYYYTPVWGYVLSAVTSVVGLLGIPLGEYVPELVGPNMVLDWTNTLPSFGYAMAIKTVLFIFDLLVAIVLFRIGMRLYGEKRAFWMFTIWFLCPFTIVISSIRMMFENLEILLLLLALLCMVERRPSWAGVMIALSLMTKPYGIFLCVLMIGYSYAQSQSMRYTAQYICAMAVTALVLFVPVILNGQLDEAMMWLTNRAYDTGTGYNSTLNLVPFILFASFVASALMALSGKASITALIVTNAVLTSMTLLNPGNIQYYLVLLPMALLMSYRSNIIVIIAFLILSGFAFISYSTWSSVLYVHEGYIGSDLLESFVSILRPIDSTLSYNWFKSVVAYTVVAVPLLECVRRRYAER